MSSEPRLLPHGSGRIPRPAVPDDVESLVQLIRDLAEYEGAADSVTVDGPMLTSALFSDSPTVFAHVSGDGRTVYGMAIWYVNFSTWSGRHGIHLEDLYVRPEARSQGIGRALVAELAAIARRSGFGRIDWSVLDWNEQALRFYRSIGAQPLDGWTSYRLSGPELAALGG